MSYLVVAIANTVVLAAVMFSSFAFAIRYGSLRLMWPVLAVIVLLGQCYIVGESLQEARIGGSFLRYQLSDVGFPQLLIILISALIGLHGPDSAAMYSGDTSSRQRMIRTKIMHGWVLASCPVALVCVAVFEAWSALVKYDGNSGQYDWADIGATALGIAPIAILAEIGRRRTNAALRKVQMA